MIHLRANSWGYDILRGERVVASTSSYAVAVNFIESLRVIYDAQPKSVWFALWERVTKGLES